MKIFDAILSKALCTLRSEFQQKIADIKSYLIATMIIVDLSILLVAFLFIALNSVLNKALGEPWGTLIICGIVAIALGVALALRKHPLKFEKRDKFL